MEPAQLFKARFGALIVPYLYFVLYPPSTTHPPDATSLIQVARFSILFSRNFYKQQLSSQTQ